MYCYYKDRFYTLNQVEFEEALRCARDDHLPDFFANLSGTRIDYNFNTMGPLVAWQALKELDVRKAKDSERKIKRES
jgi:hypothetical protein